MSAKNRGVKIKESHPGEENKEINKEICIKDILPNTMNNRKKREEEGCPRASVQYVLYD